MNPAIYNTQIHILQLCCKEFHVTCDRVTGSALDNVLSQQFEALQKSELLQLRFSKSFKELKVAIKISYI